MTSDQNDSPPVHPGVYVKETALKPIKMTVTAAAELIGISRPNVSKLLNGKADMSPDMASRIERAFQISAQTLLEMQSAYDAEQARASGNSASVRSYVPPFLKIKANDIEAWVDKNIQARTRLAVFLRTLVNSTGVGLSKVDFPGNDNAERAGWDGVVKADQGTPWIPKGVSGWEFGTNIDIKKKADGDFAKSIKALSETERKSTTFVFVTPRNWSGKLGWEKEARAKDQWKDVRVFDASNIEQWLEQSLAGQAWFANETEMPSSEVRSLDKCWDDWASVSDPILPEALFGSAIEAAKSTLLGRLSKEPNEPTTIAADSVEEALAFLSQLLTEEVDDTLASYRDRILVFDQPNVLSRLAQGTKSFIPVVHSRDVERELGPLANHMHCIVVYPRNAATSEPHITLEPASYETFKSALEGIGLDRDRISRLDDESGRSLTVLRRRMSKVEAVRTPAWSSNEDTARSLVPFLFIGAWDSSNLTDCEALSLLADQNYDAIEEKCQNLIRLNDAPVWSIGRYRGVISKIDLLFSISRSITLAELERFFSLARMVLGEDDPALDLPESERWAASVHGKAREFSGAFRNGVSETLVLLAVYGSNLFKSRLGVDTKLEAEKVISDLLPLPLETRVLEANDRDLPTYAEAAPHAFLNIIEKDLRSEKPATLGLLKPVDSGFFGSSPSRTGLLWALEGLSWNPKTLLRAVLILARLAEVKIDDNWVNKPAHSLGSIFRDWMPQTAADMEARVSVFRQLALRFPEVAWKICVAQFESGQHVGDYSHKPKWRTDGYGFGEPLKSWEPILSFRREMVSMALNWYQYAEYTQSMLHDLLERMNGLCEDDQKKVWSLVQIWATSASDKERAELREKIRVSTMTRRAKMGIKTNEASSLQSVARLTYETLEPIDILNKHAWLFRNSWVDESSEELDDDELDFRKRDERIQALRAAALKDIFEQRGSEGVFELSTDSGAVWEIGRIMSTVVLNDIELPSFLDLATKNVLDCWPEECPQKTLVQSALRSMSDSKRSAYLEKKAASLSSEDAVRLLLISPFCKSSWALVDKLSVEQKQKYWKHVTPEWVRDSDTENIEAVKRLLSAGRARAAFYSVHLDLKAIDSTLIHRMLTEMARDADETMKSYQLESYSIEKAVEKIDVSSEITLEQKAALEFAYLDLLVQPYSRVKGHGIPNIERFVEEHPEVFVQAIVWMFKRHNRGDDPEEWRVAPEDVSRLAERGFKLINGLRRIPGHDQFGELQAERLFRWIKTVRKTCLELDRVEMAEIQIGELLAKSSEGKDGVWPCEAVRQVLEELQSENIMNGMRTGVYNSRGVHWRGEGGEQERELASKYRRWAEALQFSHPFVSSSLLSGLVKTYENEADREDIEAGVRRRMY